MTTVNITNELSGKKLVYDLGTGEYFQHESYGLCIIYRDRSKHTKFVALESGYIGTISNQSYLAYCIESVNITFKRQG